MTVVCFDDNILYTWYSQYVDLHSPTYIHVFFFSVVAYIGGLCVFLSNIIRLVGHYILRVFFLFYEWLLKTFNKTSEMFSKHRQKLAQARLLRERRLSVDRQILTGPQSPTNRGSINGSIADNDDTLRSLESGRPSSPTLYDDDEVDGNFLNASLG